MLAVYNVGGSRPFRANNKNFGGLAKFKKSQGSFMLKPEEIRTLCALTPHQDELFGQVKALVQKYNRTEAEEKEATKQELFKLVQRHTYASIIRFTLFDEEIKHFCRDPDLTEHWHGYFKFELCVGKDKEKPYQMKPQDDLIPLFQAASLLCLVESCRDNKLENRPKWQQLAINYGSWLAAMSKMIEDEATLFDTKWDDFTEAVSLMSRMTTNGKMIAFSNWTPGFLLLAHTYQRIAYFIDRWTEVFPPANILRDQYYQAAYTAYCFAERLSLLPQSQIALQNASYGDVSDLQRRFKHPTVQAAKDALLERAYSLSEPRGSGKSTKEIIDKTVVQKIGLFAVTRLTLKTPEDYQSALKLIPTPIG